MVEVGNCDCWRWGIRMVGILKDQYRTKELSVAVGS
jgi:hypothetical protein